MPDIRKIKKQLTADIETYQTKARILMETASNLQDQIKPAEDTLVRFLGIQEGVNIFRQHLMERLKSYAQNPDANKDAIAELQNVLQLGANLDQAAQKQTAQQEGALSALRNVVQKLKDDSTEAERTSRAKEAQLNKAAPAKSVSGTIKTPVQEPPKPKKAAKAKTVSKKKSTKKTSKKKSAKKTSKKAAKKK